MKLYIYNRADNKPINVVYNVDKLCLSIFRENMLIAEGNNIEPVSIDLTTQYVLIVK